jgi:hypothetical protein
MNAVNRVVIVILLLVAIVLCSTLLVFPVRSLDAVAQWLTTQADSIRQYDRLSFQWFVRVGLGALFALILDVVFGFLIFLQVRRPKIKTIRVQKAAGGEVQVSVASIADRLQYEIDQLPGVLGVKSKASAKRGGVVLELDVETVSEINVPEQAGQIVEKARQVMEEKMGIKLAQPPKVNLRSVPHTGAPRRPPVSQIESAVVEIEEPVDEVIAEPSEE